MTQPRPVLGPAASLSDYYRWHVHIYDATRWAFLFGRSRLIQVAAERVRARRVLEIGCGTGKNLALLARLLPDAEIVGVDLSADMLTKAREKVARYGDRVTLREGAYREPLADGRPFDLIVFSYCLSMLNDGVNPGYAEVLRLASEDLAPQGKVAIVDFHDTRAAWFERWMGLNHVRMDGQIVEALQARDWRLEQVELGRAYAGLWRWMMCFTAR